MKKFPARYFNLMIILLGIYVALTLLHLPDAATLAKYNLTQQKAVAIILTVDIFLAFIWITAAYGFTQVLAYSRLIKRGSDEDRGFLLLAAGLGVIAFRQPIISIITNLANTLAESHPSYRGTTVIIINYVGVVAALLGFGLIAAGSDRLMRLTKKRSSELARWLFRLLALGAITAYSYLAIGQGGYQTALTPGARPNFYLPSWLIISTIIVPYGYAWYLAFIGSYQLRVYSLYVKGVLYKKALRWLAVGINIVMLNTMVIQFLSAQNSRLNKLDTGPLLLLIYILLFSIAIGFVIVAIGARRLRKIEEV